jgi:hypothetical protein
MASVRQRAPASSAEAALRWLRAGSQRSMPIGAGRRSGAWLTAAAHDFHRCWLIDDAACLFVRGDATVCWRRGGWSRATVASGRRDATEFARFFARGGLVITVVRAGIDAAAMRSQRWQRRGAPPG